MKKIFITCLFLMLAFLTYGQLSENFESGKFGSEWTFYHEDTGMTGLVNSWNIARCDSLPAGLKNFPSLCGKFVAYAQCGGGAAITDSWMITPRLTVRQGDYLKFAISDPFAYGMTHDTLDIMISETTADKSAFTSCVMRIIPRSSIPWKENCVDLSSFAGKSIYIAFRDYHSTRGSFVREYLFLDNISISGTPSYDMSMENIVTPVNGCSTEQKVKVVVKNNGIRTNRFTIAYQTDEGKSISETFDKPLENGESDTITLATPVVLKEGINHTVKVWVKNELSDMFIVNDSASVAVKIGAELEFPYKMTDGTGASDFAAIGSTPDAWQFSKLKDTDRYAWVLFGKTTNIGSTLISNCIPFTEEKVMVSFKYHASHDINLIIQTGAPFANAFMPVDTIQLPASADFKDGQIMLTLPKESSSIGFRAQFPKAMWNDYCEFAIQDVEIDAARTDLAARSIEEPVMSGLLVSGQGHNLKVVFRNSGAGNIKEADLCYRLDNEPVVRENVTTDIPEGQNLEYSFNRKVMFDKVGDHLLKVWCEVYGDIKTSNDTISKHFLIYEAKEFPFTATFADSVENCKWSVINKDQDEVFWSFMKNPAAVKEGALAYKNSISGIVSNDYLITPAIRIPEGKARLSFYYATSSYNTGTGKLKVLMGTEPDPEKMTTVLFDSGLTNTGWLNGFALFSIDHADHYYFAFYGYGTSGDIYLDYVKVDAEEDLCMNSIAFSQTSGFNKSKSDVNVSFINHGVSAQTDIPVSYYIEGKLISSEKVPGSVLPGDTVYYTFKNQADISVPDSTYRIMAKIDKPVGEDTFNDQMIGWALEHWANKKIPYLQSFENAKDLYKWFVPTTSEGWLFQNNMFYAYDGNNFMYHGNQTKAAENWIFSECVEISAGTYDLSFFYRTMKNMDSDPYKQKFKVMLGTGTSAEEMDMLIVDYNGITESAPAWKKHSGKIRIAQDGKYYIGFYNYSNPGQGGTYIDNLEITSIVKGKELPYTADFDTREAEWMKFNPSYTFYQWNYEKLGFDSFMWVNKDGTYNQPEGMLVSPALAITADKEVKLTVDYAAVSEVDSVRLNLYMGSVNNPDSMTLAAKLALSPEFTQFVYEFKLPVGKPCYFGFRSNSYAQYELKLAGFKAEYKEEEGIDEVSVSTSVYVSDKTLYVFAGTAVKRLKLLDVAGRCLYDNSSFDGNKVIISDLSEGVYLVCIESEAGNVIRKIRVN